jgi:hypothetical protein
MKNGEEMSARKQFWSIPGQRLIQNSMSIPSKTCASTLTLARVRRLDSRFRGNDRANG